MTITEWLVENMKKLKQAGVDSPRRDCLVFLEDTLGKDRAWVVSNPEHRLQIQSLKTLSRLIDRRVGREPLAYIRGKAWFYGRLFYVDPSVMIPRPESEDFIEIIREINPGELVDLGTGSGCLAITAKLELPKCSVFAYDIDQNALETARKNALKHRANIVFAQSDMLQHVANSPFTLVANLPYVPEGLITSPEIQHEPATALFSGKDGLNHYRRFWTEILNSLQQPQHILIESLENQHAYLKNLANKSGYTLSSTINLVQRFDKKNV